MWLRRSLLLALLALVLPLGVIASSPTTGHAWETWCEDDPGVLVNGQEIILAVSVPQESLGAVGAAQFVVTVPEGVNASLAENDAVWFPDAVTIQTSDESWNGKGAIAVDVAVTVAGSQSLPVQFLIKKPNLPLTNIVTGVTNQSLTRNVELPTSLFGSDGAAHAR